MKAKNPVNGEKVAGHPRATGANCVMVRFSDKQYAEFLSMYEQSGIRSKARFILARIFWRCCV
jgi:hypothetical protein